MKSFFKNVTSYAQSNYATGKVVTNEKTCTGCKLCVEVCPATALEMNDRKKSQMIAGADCISCGNCTAVCHTRSILIERFYCVPDGVYETQGRIQSTGDDAFPRFFGRKA